jgi:ankyrin repeat protein
MKISHKIMNNELFEKVEKNDEVGLKGLISGRTIKEVKDDFGYSLLHRSITKGFDRISEVLIKNGVNVNARDKNGQTALHYAAFYGNIVVAELLLDKGADIHISDNYGNQALWTAVFNDKGFGKRLEIIKILVKKGAEIGHRNNAGKTPLDFATSNKYIKVVELLENR